MKEMCAYCVALVYRYANDGYLRLDDAPTMLHPREFVQKVLEGHRVEYGPTREAYSLAVTRINGTAVCGWHAYDEMQKQRRV